MRGVSEDLCSVMDRKEERNVLLKMKHKKFVRGFGCVMFHRNL